MPVIGKALHTKLEEDNKHHNEYAVAVILDRHTVGYVLILYNFSYVVLVVQLPSLRSYSLPPWHEAVPTV